MKQSRQLKKISSPQSGEVRENRRYAVEETFLRTSWIGENGALKIVRDARVVNISEKGIALRLPEPVELQSRISLESDKHELLGQGVVRHCDYAVTSYIVGVEFIDWLRWRAPEGPVVEPIRLSAPLEEEAAPSDAVSHSDACEMLSPFHTGLDQEFQGFRMPMAIKAGAPVLAALGLGLYLLLGGVSKAPAASSESRVSMKSAGEQGWVTEWASDQAGSRRGRQITLYRPSAQLSDYKMQFTGQIEKKALSWVFRAADTKNYYGMKIEMDKPGTVRFTRFAVVQGRESSVSGRPLPIQVRPGSSDNRPVAHFS